MLNDQDPTDSLHQQRRSCIDERWGCVLLQPPMTAFPRTVMLLGSGDLGKEVAIAAQRLGC